MAKTLRRVIIERLRSVLNHLATAGVYLEEVKSYYDSYEQKEEAEVIEIALIGLKELYQLLQSFEESI